MIVVYILTMVCPENCSQNCILPYVRSGLCKFDETAAPFAAYWLCHWWLYALVQGSANFSGTRAGWAPKELAAGRTAKFYRERFNNCGLAHPPHHDVMSSAKALRGNVEIFGILFKIELLRSTPVHQFSAL